MFKKRHNMGLGFFGTTVSNWCNSARGPSNEQRATSNEQRATSNEHEYNYFSRNRVVKKYHYARSAITFSPGDAREKTYVHKVVQT